MITYKTVEFGETVRQVPMLHKVHFNHHIRQEVFNWCMSNCKADFYPGPSWAGNFVEFEDDKDAMWFRLRWS